MKKLIVLVLLPIIGMSAGAAGAFLSRPTTESTPKEEIYFTFDTPFSVPIIKNDIVIASAELSLSLAVKGIDHAELERKNTLLRDRMMSTLLDHASSGGFDGRYTDSSVMAPLRNRLQASGEALFENSTIEVLITALQRTELH